MERCSEMCIGRGEWDASKQPLPTKSQWGMMGLDSVESKSPEISLCTPSIVGGQVGFLLASRLGSPLQRRIVTCGRLRGRKALDSTGARQEVPLWTWDDAYGKSRSFYTWIFTAVFRLHFVLESPFCFRESLCANCGSTRAFTLGCVHSRTVLKATSLRKHDLEAICKFLSFFEVFFGPILAVFLRLLPRPVLNPKIEGRLFVRSPLSFVNGHQTGCRWAASRRCPALDLTVISPKMKQIVY